jgi:purine-binding chemotaxis protein CheW
MAELQELTLADLEKEVSEQTEKNTDVGQKKQLIIFKLGSEEYALNIDQIKEVVLTPGIAKIPQTPSYVKGVANIRGTIIAIIDLNDKFKIGDENDTIGKFTLVVESEEFKVGILVKEVPNTLTVGEKEIETNLSILQYSDLDEECITGIVKKGDRMIIIVDMVKMMNLEDFNNFNK